MPVLCAIPGLIWPSAGLSEVLSGRSLPRDLPGLSALLARADIRHAAPCALDTWLCKQFGVFDEPPFAALRLAGEQDTPPKPDTIWVCADPVSLRFARQHLLLDGPATLNLAADEIEILLRDLNASFADIGRFRFTSLEHGYIGLNPAHADKLAVTLAPLPDVVNRPVAQFQPRGEHAAWWSRLNNELQVFCHTHAVNVAREARGAPALNSLWLWGAGRLPTHLTPPATSMTAMCVQSQPNLSGLVLLAQTRLAPFDKRHAADWMLIDALHEPAQDRDAARWSKALQKLDADVLVPLSQQLKARKISRLTLVSPGDTALTRIEISAAPRWQLWRQFWQSEASHAQLIAALSGPVST